MHRHLQLPSFLSSSPSLPTLLSLSFIPRSMETAPSFSSSIAAADAPPAASDTGEGIPVTSSVADASGDGDSTKEFGFERPEVGRELLVGTVQSYDRHVFLRYKSPEFWPPNVEAAESGGLPKLLAAAIKARKNDMKYKTRLTICGVEDNNDTSDGEVLMFPERIAYRGLTDVSVDKFVEIVLVNDTEWFHGPVKSLTGSYVFVCAHGSRDRRCGVCGPVLIEKFKEEIFSRHLEGEVFVSPCSHIGGHKYAGNVIIFGPSKTGEVSGHWYGYVTPDDVPILLEQHIGKGEIIDHLWRGQMGLSEEDQRKAQNMRRQQNSGLREDGASGCCQGNGNPNCCQNAINGKSKADHSDISNEQNSNNINDNKSKSSDKSSIQTWFKEPGCDMYAALAIVTAIASIGGAYCYYRHLK